MIYLCACFRMIFVVLAYESVRGHTAGFLGLQTALLLVAIMNTTQIIYTGQSYPTWNLSETRTKRLAKVYLVVNYIISAIKLSATVNIVATGSAPSYYKQHLFGNDGDDGDDGDDGYVVGQLVDHAWMFMNAILPLIIAWVRMKNEDPLTIKITMPQLDYAEPNSDETDDESSEDSVRIKVAQPDDESEDDNKVITGEGTTAPGQVDTAAALPEVA